MRVCTEDKGLGDLMFDILVGVDEIESDLELRTLLKTLDICLAKFQKTVTDGDSTSSYKTGTY